MVSCENVAQPTKAYCLDAPSYWTNKASNTFHARDIFGPVSGHLSNGVNPAQMGSQIQDIVALTESNVYVSDGVIHVEVVHVDRFGNMITNIPGIRLMLSNSVLTIGGFEIYKISTSYASDDSLIAIIGSHGFLEISTPGGNASAKLGSGNGTQISIVPQAN